MINCFMLSTRNKYRKREVGKAQIQSLCSACVSCFRLLGLCLAPRDLPLSVLLTEIYFPVPLHLLINTSTFLELSSSFLQYSSIQLIERSPAGKGAFASPVQKMGKVRIHSTSVMVGSTVLPGTTCLSGLSLPKELRTPNAS